MQVMPSGTVTFLFTDIEGSTRMWDQYPEAMQSALARHDGLMRQIIETHSGHVFKIVGDGMYAAFPVATSALEAALAAQLALGSESWPDPIVIKVRMALHTGTAEMRDGDYFGGTLNRVSRLLSAGHGGQVLVSRVTQELLQDEQTGEWSLVSLGEHRLRDLNRAEMIFQALHRQLPGEFPSLKSLDSPEFPNNLPIQLTSFIGREKEIGEIGTLLEKSNLVTLTGSGGAGKTRLSVQVAANALERFPDGVWQVELASISEGRLVAPTVAKFLGVAEQVGITIEQKLVRDMKEKRLLLLLDNCEHLLGSCAELCSNLLRGCPDLKIIATSREPLGIWGEQGYRVPSLTMPDPKQSVSMKTATEFESVRLLIDRATLVRPEFAATEQNAAALVQICSRLDGIPLAIELAAARVRSMSAEDINARLDNRFRLLTSGARNALPRQQTLRALIDWSYELLTEPERKFLTRLSVFAGGWTLEMAERICTSDGIDEWDVLDLLSGLIDKSLVASEDVSGAGRYRLLETVRQYAAERMEAGDDRGRVKSRHRDAFLAFAEEAEPQLTGPQQQEWLDRVEREHDNLRVALNWCAEDPQGAEPGLRISGALQRFWSTRGHLSEGREHLSRALASSPASAPSPSRARALVGLGRLSWLQGDYAPAQSSFHEALKLRRDLGDESGAAYALLNLGNVACDQGHFDDARTFNDECLALYRGLDDRSGIANALGNLGNVALDQGRYATSIPFYRECLDLQREMNNTIGVAAACHNLGLACLYEEDYAQAQSLFEEGLRLFRELQHKSGTASMLNNLGIVAVRQGQSASARTLFEESLSLKIELGDKKGVAHGLEEMAAAIASLSDPWKATRVRGAASALRESIGVAHAPGELAQQAKHLDQLREALGDSAFESAWHQGRTLTLEEAVAEALSS
jgi:predicted ATPase/class 3 adenylate cyclase/uncharacterized protein HemY